MPVREDPKAAYRWRWLVLGALLTAEAMNVLDATIVQVAAPVIRAGLGGSESAIQWFSSAYTLPFAAFLILGGRLGDLFGRRRVFLIGVAGFATASSCCALAPTAGALIGARTVQGTAAALIIPQTIGLIRSMFDGSELAKAMGAIGPVMGLSVVFGPMLGAVLTHADLFGSSWRSAFLVNVPLAVAVLAAGPVAREDRAARASRLDLPGTGLVVLGAGLVVYPLIEGGDALRPGWSAALLVAGALVLVAFGLHQRRRARRGRVPLIEPSLFGDRVFPAALATSTLLFAVTTGLMLVVVLQVQLGLGRDVLTAGLTLLPWSVGMAISSAVVGTRMTPGNQWRIMFAGLATLFAGLLGALAAYLAAYPWLLVAALLVSGAGNGMATVPFFTAALARLRPHQVGSAAGLLNAVQQFGGTLGIALLGSVFLHRLVGGPDANAAAALAFGLALVLLAATAVAAAFMRTPAGRSPEQEHATTGEPSRL
ncbi:MFS transporter [Nonomuraea sp. NPDC050153]|uniref:MFS transporter n=1 Tax=Nonomuraea sp. NPDC050153 TaxID=3364359 RepID=UPI00379C9E43